MKMGRHGGLSMTECRYKSQNMREKPRDLDIDTAICNNITCEIITCLFRYMKTASIFGTFKEKSLLNLNIYNTISRKTKRAILSLHQALSKWHVHNVSSIFNPRMDELTWAQPHGSATWWRPWRWRQRWFVSQERAGGEEIWWRQIPWCYNMLPAMGERACRKVTKTLSEPQTSFFSSFPSSNLACSFNPHWPRVSREVVANVFITGT